MVAHILNNLYYLVINLITYIKKSTFDDSKTTNSNMFDIHKEIRYTMREKFPE